MSVPPGHRTSAARKGAVLFLLFCILPAVVLTSCGQKPTQEKSLKDHEAAKSSRRMKRGRTLYERYCSACHGKKGLGDGRYVATELTPKPTDLTRSGPDALDGKQLESWIRQGSSAFNRSDLCPPWGQTLAEGDIRVLDQFVRSMRTGNNSTEERTNEIP